MHDSKEKKKDLQAAIYHNKYTEKTPLIHNSQEVKGCVEWADFTSLLSWCISVVPTRNLQKNNKIPMQRCDKCMIKSFRAFYTKECLQM